MHAQHVHSDDLCLKKSDGTETCVTGDQLAALADAGASTHGTNETPATIPAAAASATSGPPIIAINGDNPATIQVGTTYADLGATISGPQQDLNLGIHLYIDGSATDAVAIDTTTPATHSIDYVVTGISGLTSTSTRTVIVSAPATTISQTGTQWPCASRFIVP